MAGYDVTVIGAGAAGLLCAIEAGKRGRKVLVLERAEKPGKKILISGGGRCNFTNKNISYRSYLSDNPDFCRSALSRYTQHDVISLVEKYDIAYYEKKDGQLFCESSARQILDLLLEECREAKVDIQAHCKVNLITKSDLFTVDSSIGCFEAQSLVIATGGPSIPKMGATGFGYDIARQFGLNIIEPRPALVPLLFGDEELKAFCDIAGISFNGILRCGKTRFQDDILFTHKGLSGPAILQISSYWKQGEPIEIDLLPGVSVMEWVVENKRIHKKIPNILSQYVPHRLTDAWCAFKGFTDYFDHLSNKRLEQLEHELHHWQIIPKDTEGFDKAEVTAGGVDTKELSSKTMEASKVPGLYFIGEVVDVTGWLGGYNFQWAWSSGWAAGQIC